jgi:hypothetical protein
MLELETAISEWRRRMLAAGIESPEQLDELESHLREEIVRRIHLGARVPEALVAAQQELGQPAALKAEFGKTRGLYAVLSQRRTLKIPLSVNRVLGLIWLGFTLPMLLRVSVETLTSQTHGAKIWLVFLILSSATLGSGLLIYESNWGRILVRANALLWLGAWLVFDRLVAWLAGPLDVHPTPLRQDLAQNGMFLGFMLITMVILHLPGKANLKFTVRL